jgi:hypothetical protein
MNDEDEAARVASVMEGYALARQEWLSLAYGALRDVASRRSLLTTNDVWPLVAYPTFPSGGRLMGKVIRYGLSQHWIAKDKLPDGGWRVLDHTDLPLVHTIDGMPVKHRVLVPAYRSLLLGPAP